MKKTLFFLTAMLSAAALHAATREVPVNFIHIPPFARAAAMAESFYAVSDGSYGLYYNPAGMTSILGYEGQISYVSWPDDIKYFYFGLINPDPVLSWGKIGLSFAWFQVDRPKDWQDAKLVNWNAYGDKEIFGNYSVSFGSSFDVSDFLGTGVNLRWTYEYTPDESRYSNLYADIGLLGRFRLPGNYLRVGLGLSSTGPKFKPNIIGLDVPDTLNTGVSDEFDLFSSKALVSLQAVFEPWRKSAISAGAEYYVNSMFPLRLGYRLGESQGFTAGTGFRFREFELDYAFTAYNDIGPAHTLSLVFSWGTPPVGLTVAPATISADEKSEFNKTFLIPQIREKELLKKAWINVYDNNGLIKIGKVDIADPSVEKIEWDGKVDGKPLQGGAYKISLEAEYVVNGTSESWKQAFDVDSTGPSVAIIGEPVYLKPGESDALLIPATFKLSAKDKNGVNGWEVVITDEEKKVFFTVSGTGEPPAQYVWDGKGLNGRYVETAMMYYYYFAATDSLGNRSETAPKFQLILMKEIKLTFSSDALFAAGKSDMKIENYNKLKEMKKTLKQYPQSDILIAGYTDNSEPIGKFKDLKELSEARAKAVMFFMVNILGIEEERINAKGFGSDVPVDTADTAKARASNRRVEVIIKSTIYK